MLSKPFKYLANLYRDNAIYAISSAFFSGSFIATITVKDLGNAVKYFFYDPNNFEIIMGIFAFISALPLILIGIKEPLLHTRRKAAISRGLDRIYEGHNKVNFQIESIAKKWELTATGEGDIFSKRENISRIMLAFEARHIKLIDGKDNFQKIYGVKRRELEKWLTRHPSVTIPKAWYKR